MSNNNNQMPNHHEVFGIRFHINIISNVIYIEI